MSTFTRINLLNEICRETVFIIIRCHSVFLKKFSHDKSVI